MLARTECCFDGELPFITGSAAARGEIRELGENSSLFLLVFVVAYLLDFAARLPE